jgi:GT2 family glycosyltransferase
VQGQEWLKPIHKDLIEEKVENYFDKSHLIFTHSNRGTGLPRHNMVHKALDFNTPYIMTTDDDMFFPPGSVEALISILEDNPELGAIDLWVHPNLNAWFMRPNKMQYKQPKQPFEYVDGMGSATMIMRREVFETCDYDINYYVGWADIDFCMQMRKSNWKLGILAIPEYKAFNYKGRGTDDYRKYTQYRHDAQHAGNSSIRFQEKWHRQI